MSEKIIDRKVFFNYARRAPFGGRLNQQQVTGTDDILDYWEANYAGKDIRWLAYYLATVFHETAGRMVPVREGSNSRRLATDAQAIAAAKYVYDKGITKVKYYTIGRFGFVPYGRGRVQVTLDDNYSYVSRRLGVPTDKIVEMLLDSQEDLRISMPGTIEGWWTRGRHKMSDYFDPVREDPEGARRIVNGKDKAKLIAGYYYSFKDALEIAMAPERPADITTSDAAPDDEDPKKDKSVIAALSSFAAGSGGLAALGALDNVYALIAFFLVLIAGGIGLWLLASGRVTFNRK